MRAYPLKSAQDGAALVVSLVLLVVLSLLASGSIRGVSVQEKMTAASFDRALAFQAVEAALREAEALVVPGSNPTFPASGCSSGLCARPDATNLERWNDSSFSGWQTASSSMGSLVGSTAQFIIEDMGTAPRWFGCDRIVPISAYCLAPRYRITAVSGATGRANVMLQVTYVPG